MAPGKVNPVEPYSWFGIPYLDISPDFVFALKLVLIGTITGVLIYYGCGIIIITDDPSPGLYLISAIKSVCVVAMYSFAASSGGVFVGYLLFKAIAGF